MSFVTPVEIDTEINRLLVEEIKPRRVLQAQHSYLASKGAMPSHLDHSSYFNQEKFDAATRQLEELRQQRHAIEDLYTGWPRYYHVSNVNGHIHDSLRCSSCFPDTEYIWRTDLSGLTDEEVVAKEAYNVCSVCMPIAPAEQKAARQRYNAERREAKRIETEAHKLDKLRNKALRAIKFLAKVDGLVEKTFGSWDALWANYSLYGKDGKRSLYEASYELPSQVGDYLYDEMEARHPGSGRRSRHFADPKQIIAEARAAGLIKEEQS